MPGEIVALWTRFLKISELVPPPTAPLFPGPPKHQGGYLGADAQVLCGNLEFWPCLGMEPVTPIL